MDDNKADMNKQSEDSETTETVKNKEERDNSESSPLPETEAEAEQDNDAETKDPDSDKSEEPEESESERYLRLAAEFDNYKKRTAREFGELIRHANFRLLRSLIEITDSFERAIGENGEKNNFDAYKKGVELIYSQFDSLLEKENVKSIEAVGKPFDPNLHEAMMQQESDEYDEGLVVQEVQKGYQIENKVLRHARVIVSSGKAKPDKNDKKENN